MRKAKNYLRRDLKVAQPDYTRRDSSVNGVKRTLSRIDRASIKIPVAEARDFHCTAHVFENLRKRSMSSDHTAVCVDIQKQTQMVNIFDVINPAFHLPMKIPMTNIQKAPFQFTHIYAGGGMLSNHLKYNKVVWIGTRVSIFLMVVFDVSPGILKVLLDL